MQQIDFAFVHCAIRIERWVRSWPADQTNGAASPVGKDTKAIALDLVYLTGTGRRVLNWADEPQNGADFIGAQLAPKLVWQTSVKR